MDHIIIIIGEWRSDAICNDPRVWIKGGSTVDQHGSTWIKRLQHAHSACRRRGSWLMCHASWLMAHALSPFSVPLTWHASGVRRQASGVRRQASGVRRQASGVMRHASGVMRHASHSRGMRQASGVPLTWHASGVQPLHSAPRHAPGVLVIGLIL